MCFFVCAYSVPHLSTPVERMNMIVQSATRNLGAGSVERLEAIIDYRTVFFAVCWNGYIHTSRLSNRSDF